jgi:hypothetical protein
MLNLNELLTLMRGGVYTPQETLGVYDAQEQARRERRQTRKADLAEMLSGLQTAAYEGALEGTSLDALLANPAVSSVAGTLGPDALTSALSPYYHGVTNPDSRNFGISKLNESLDAEDQQAILSDFYPEMQDPAKTLEDARQVIQNQAAQRYGPKVYTILRSQIDELLNNAFADTYKPAGRGTIPRPRPT